MNVGAEWYLHTIYTVRSSSRKVRRHSVARRAVAEDLSIGVGFNRGTNMHPIQLMEESTLEALGSVGQSSTSWIIAAILGAVLLGTFDILQLINYN